MVAVRLLAGVLVLSAILFLPAGTFLYWEAWLFMAVLFVPVTLFGAYLLRHRPVLLERRMKTREEEPQQQQIVAVALVVLLVTFLLPGFDERFGWSSVPTWLVVAADVGILMSYRLLVCTLLENEYAARTVGVEQHQRVVTTGPYAVVRHPLYLAATGMFGFAPLALGSYWAVIPATLFSALLVARILNEEKVLLRDLDGYADYCKAVRYRLIPAIW